MIAVRFAAALCVLLACTGCTSLLLVHASNVKKGNVSYTKCLFIVDQQRPDLANQAADLCKAVLNSDTPK